LRPYGRLDRTSPLRSGGARRIKGVIGNEKADEWAKLAAEEPDAHGVEWLGYADKYEGRPMPLPRALANIKRETSEKKWTEARCWVEGRITAKKYKM
jgi:hypothetical protein